MQIKSDPDLAKSLEDKNKNGGSSTQVSRWELFLDCQDNTYKYFQNWTGKYIFYVDIKRFLRFKPLELKASE
jgi:hypothetical protein